jgi:nitroreductase
MTIEKAENFFALMETRRSTRQFQSYPVDDAVIELAIRTAGSAPSGANKQPWFFAVIKNEKLKERLRFEAEQVEREFYFQNASDAWLKDLEPLRTGPVKPYLTQAPAIIAVFSRATKVSDCSTERTYYSRESTGIATGMLITALHQAGLATLTHTPSPMGFLNDLLDLDSSFRPYILVVTGYPERDCYYPKISRKHVSKISRVY